MKITRVRWRDSRMYITQESRDADFDVTVIENIGFVLEESRDHIVLAGNLVDGDVRRVIVIPRENIL
jgi:hypothetical protein